MRSLLHLIASYIGNFAGLELAARLVPNFSISSDLMLVLGAAALLTGINILLRPILKLAMGPLIILTLGLATILVNAILLLFLDFVSPGVTIMGLSALAAGTIVIGGVNIAVHLGEHLLVPRRSS